MPDVGKVLKDEIARISRKESKAAVTPLRAASVQVRKDLGDLKKRAAVLEKAIKQLQTSFARVAPAPQAATEVAGGERGGISGKGIKSLRKRLGVSQAEFAKLVGVSDQAVYLWERKPGLLKLRGATKASLSTIRGMGAREARARLDDIAKAAKVKKPAAKRKKR